jgi:GNAT superfamily N-acetyltransferase
MRRLFYRFSDQAVYYRYFARIKTMPHGKMQEYVNVDYRRVMSIVGIVQEKGIDRIIAEGRYVRLPDRPYADTAFLVDEAYQGKGISTYLLNMLIRIAASRGHRGVPGRRAARPQVHAPRLRENALPAPRRRLRGDLRDRHLLPGPARAGGDQADGGGEAKK